MERRREDDRGGRKNDRGWILEKRREKRGEVEEGYLALDPGSVGLSCQRDSGMKKGRWSRWRVRRRGGAGCGGTERA